MGSGEKAGTEEEVARADAAIFWAFQISARVSLPKEYGNPAPLRADFLQIFCKLCMLQTKELEI